ncbi:MAG: hypothetical protein J6W98_06335 [Bacteroidales bacterium]|nr:hypothetical protein [Bacteroidales bacterium]
MPRRILLLTSLILVSALAAEAGEKEVRDFRFVRDVTPALQLSNPAALGRWTGQLSCVTLTGAKGNGALVPLEGSGNDFSISAGTESFYRMSDRLTFHGKLSWSDFQGQGMGGPALIAPELHPVSFLESDPTTTGPRKRELYGLSGALALDLGPRWALGLGADYTAGDQTKVKDPRFTSVLMDLDIAAGVTFRPSDALLLGLSLHYRDMMEQLRGAVYGVNDTQYFIWTDKGAFLGSSAGLVGDMAYVSTQNLRPMADRYFGLSLQALVRERLSNELSVRYRTGYYGKKASSSPVFFECAGMEAAYKGVLVIPSGFRMQRISLDLGVTVLGNDENVFRYVTPPGQSTVVEYGGQNHVLDRVDVNAVLDYRWYGEVAGTRPGETLGARIAFAARRQTSNQYPVWRRQAVNTLSLDLFGQKVWMRGPLSFVLDLALCAQAGFGTEKEDGSYAPGASSGVKSFDEYLGRYYEYKTLPRAGASAGFTLARRFPAGFEIYLGVSDEYVQLLSEARWLGGQYHNLACITLGCNF